MYSAFYQYFEIRSDEEYSKNKPTKEIAELLEETKVLRKNGDTSFVNNDNFPWLNIAFHVDGNTCNLLSITTSKKDPSNEEKYLYLLSSISKNLGWELILEEDE